MRHTNRARWPVGIVPITAYSSRPIRAHRAFSSRIRQPGHYPTQTSHGICRHTRMLVRIRGFASDQRVCGVLSRWRCLGKDAVLRFPGINALSPTAELPWLAAATRENENSSGRRHTSSLQRPDDFELSEFVFASDEPWQAGLAIPESYANSKEVRGVAQAVCSAVSLMVRLTSQFFNHQQNTNYDQWLPCARHRVVAVIAISARGRRLAAVQQTV